MQINTTVTREYYAQERYYTSASKRESFLTDQANNLNMEEEIVRDHRKTKTAEECFNEMNSDNSRITDMDDISSEMMEPLGMGMILVKGGTGYGMTASQIINPGIEDAVVRVRLASGDSYDVKISEVDPQNATVVEMFAYCQYADANGMGVNNHFGSCSVLKTFMGSDGKVLELDSLEDAATKKMDWKGSVSSSRISLLNQKTGDTVSAADIIEMFENLQKAAVDRENEKTDKDWRYMSDEEWDEFVAVIDEKIEDIARFIKTDENGNNYVDKEMTHSKYFKYFGLMQFTTISEEELQKGLEFSALKDRGLDHYGEVKKEEPDLYAFDISVIMNNALQNALEASAGLPEPEISITSVRRDQVFIINIKNRIRDRIYIGEDGLPETTKSEKDHGYGLKNIVSVARKYKGDLEIRQEERHGKLYFILNVMMVE